MMCGLSAIKKHKVSKDSIVVIVLFMICVVFVSFWIITYLIFDQYVQNFNEEKKDLSPKEKVASDVTSDDTTIVSK